MYWLKFGNTRVSVEARNYDGVCMHCGKTGIKYLAHVQQSVADTLDRALDGRLERDEDEIALLGANLFSGNTQKEMEVGCVCVSKYLADCGVDTGLATRFQKGVNKLTGILKNIARLEKMMTPEGCNKIREEFAVVVEAMEVRTTFSERYKEAFALHRSLLENVDVSEEDKAEGQRKYRDAFGCYRAASRAATHAEEKFRGKHFSIYLTRSYYSNVPLTDDVLCDKLGRKLNRYQARLSVYANGGSYIA